MRHVLEVLERRADELATEPFFEFLRDTRIDPRQRLSFVPALAHFVMTFSDLYGLIFRQEPATDRYQELVNAATHEDDGHWRWFLADLQTLGLDPQVRFSDALELVWSDATVQMRLLSYHMCRLGLGADALHKLVLIHCIEAAGKVALRHSAAVASELAAHPPSDVRQSLPSDVRQSLPSTGKALVYFGAHHLDTEGDHTLDKAEVQQWLARIELTAELSRELSSLVDTSFVLFTAFVRELLAFAQSGRRIGQI